MINSIIGIIGLICAIWVIYEVLTKNKRRSTLSKIIWIVCAIFFNIITAVVYYFFGRKR